MKLHKQVRENTIFYTPVAKQEKLSNFSTNYAVLTILHVHIRKASTCNIIHPCLEKKMGPENENYLPNSKSNSARNVENARSSVL